MGKYVFHNAHDTVEAMHDEIAAAYMTAIGLSDDDAVRQLFVETPIDDLIDKAVDNWSLENVDQFQRTELENALNRLRAKIAEVSLHAVHNAMEAFNAAAAPGSECAAWQDFVKASYDRFSVGPWSFTPAMTAPHEFATYWLEVAAGGSADYDTDGNRL